MSPQQLPLIGREQDVERLIDLHRGLGADRAGRLVLLSAEAGGGKTALLQAVRHQLPPDTAVGFGAAIDLGDEAAPLLPIHDAVAELAASTPAEERLDLDRERSLLSMLDALSTAEAGSVLMVDDLHWADPNTLAFLRLVASRLASLPLLIVATFRSDIARNHPLRATVGELSRSPLVTRLTVEPLGRAAIAELYIRRHGEPADQLTLDRLVERTAGNPFHVTEAIDAGPDVDRLPLSLEDSLVHRLEQLPATVLDLVRVAAVAGPVSIDHLAEVSPIPDEVYADAVRASVEAGVLEVDGELVRFRHALLAEAAMQTVLPFEVEEIHLRLGRSLERADGPDTLDQLARKARHWRLAGRAEQAIEAAATAAARAKAQQFHAMVFVQTSTMLELWDQVDGADTVIGRPRHLLLLETAEAASELGRAEEAVRLGRGAYETVAQGVQETPEPGLDALEARADVTWRFGYILYAARRLTEAHRLIEDEAQSIIDRPPRLGFARLLVAWIGISMSIGRYEIGADCDPRLIAMVEALDDPQVRGRLLSFRGACATATGRLDQGLQMLEQATEILADADDHTFAANACLTRVQSGFVHDHLDDLVDRADRGLVRSAGAPTSRLLALAGIRAELLHYAGRSEEARETFESGSARLIWRTAAERALTLATLALDSGQMEPAERLLASPDVAAAAHNPPMALRADLLHCRLLAVTDPDQAGVRVLECISEATATGKTLHRALALTYAWEWVEEDSTWRQGLIDLTRKVADGPTVATEVSPVGAWHALLAAHGSELDPAAWDRAVEVCRRAGMRQDEGRALLGSAAVQLATGRRAEAGERLTAAERLADTIDNAQLARSARELRRRGRLEPGQEQDSLGIGERLGLTGRESEVLELLAGGRTNAEIAERLFISPKTASVHVSNLLRKLEVPNRREAGRLARELGIGS